MNSTWIGVLSMGLLDRPGIDGLLRGDRQREEEHRPLTHFRFGPDASPMPVHDALNRRQPDAGAGVLACGMKALKPAQKLSRIRHLEPPPVLPDTKHRPPAILHAAE